MANAADAQLVYYQVVGNSSRQLRHELNDKGPLDDGKRFDAYTTWHVRWTFRYASQGDGCRLTEIHTSLDGTIELPRWERSSDASPSLVEKWERYLAALRIHEDGHYAHGMAAEKEVDALGQSFRIAGSCTTMAQAFNDKAGAIVARYAAMDATYDRDTHHGKNQGATFP
ncbi:MAG TPA: DUF922 domain-containing protein [Rhodanobacter sp.]|nr:DUF922 domain-containing protein [Rhodanobacter sp.]